MEIFKNFHEAPPRRRRTIECFGILGYILHTMVVYAFIFVAVGICLHHDFTCYTEKLPQYPVVSLKHILDDMLVEKQFNGSWNGNNIIYKRDNVITMLNIETKEITRLLADEFNEFDSFEMSADGKYLLISKRCRKVFRHSFASMYHILRISTGVLFPLVIEGGPKLFKMVKWAPTGNGLIVHYNGNLYYKNAASEYEVALTIDSDIGISNGLPNQFYEEEVFTSNSAVWFSPNNEHLAFLQFDDTPLKPSNSSVCGDSYPVDGFQNTRVKVIIADLYQRRDLKNVPLDNVMNSEIDYIITAVNWLSNGRILVVLLNNLQYKLHMVIFDGIQLRNIFDFELKDHWIGISSTVFKTSVGSQIAFIAPDPQDVGGPYNKLVILHTDANKFSQVLTNKKHVIVSILYWNEYHNVIFYTASTEETYSDVHVYAIKVDHKSVQCLTCKLHVSNETEQTYYSAIFNDDYYVVITSLGPDVPRSDIYFWYFVREEIVLENIITWEDNEGFRSTLRNHKIPMLNIERTVMANGIRGKVLIQYSPDLNTSTYKEYSLLVEAFDGQYSWSANGKWAGKWSTYFSATHSVVYAKIYGHGSGLNGNQFLNSAYLKFAGLDVVNQVNIIQEIKKEYQFLHENKVGIWGKNYGGYVAAKALASSDDTFLCAAAVAPVLVWTYSNSIYSQRYMAIRNQNELGYPSSSLIQNVTLFKKKKFLLVHNTSDNSLYQQSTILANNLKVQGIPLNEINYEGDAHLYHSLNKFFGECFKNSRLPYSQAPKLIKKN